MYLLRIAVRNLKRRRKRTMIIALILIITAIFFLLLESFVLGLFGSAFDNAIDVKTPHIEIAEKEFITTAEDRNQDLSLKNTFVPSNELLEEIKGLEGFSGLTRVLDFSADFIAGRHDYPVLVRSLDPDSFGEVFRNEEFLETGEFIKEDSAGVVIGDQLADFFDIGVGDYYTLRFQDERGSFNTIEGEVKGIISTPDPEINSGTVFVSREYSVDRLGLDNDRVSQLMIRLEERDKVSGQVELLQDKIRNTGLAVRSYREIEEFIVSGRTWNMMQTYFLLACFLLVGVIGIFSAIVLAALERVEEIGMMKAMGLKESEIIKVFALEAAGIGVIGGFIGCVIGGALVYLFKTFGLSAEMLGYDELGVFAIEGSIIYGVWSFSSIVMVFVFLIVISIIASIIPAFWAARKDPVKAIHHR